MNDPVHSGGGVKTVVRAMLYDLGFVWTDVQVKREVVEEVELEVVGLAVAEDETPTQYHSLFINLVKQFSPLGPRIVFQAYNCWGVMPARLAKAEHEAPVGFVCRYLVQDATMPLCVGPGAPDGVFVVVVVDEGGDDTDTPMQ